MGLKSVVLQTNKTNCKDCLENYNTVSSNISSCSRPHLLLRRSNEKLTGYRYEKFLQKFCVIYMKQRLVTFSLEHNS